MRAAKDSLCRRAGEIRARDQKRRKWPISDKLDWSAGRNHDGLLDLEYTCRKMDNSPAILFAA